MGVDGMVERIAITIIRHFQDQRLGYVHVYPLRFVTGLHHVAPVLYSFVDYNSKLHVGLFALPSFVKDVGADADPCANVQYPILNVQSSISNVKVGERSRVYAKASSGILRADAGIDSRFVRAIVPEAGALLALGRVIRVPHVAGCFQHLK